MIHMHDKYDTRVLRVYQKIYKLFFGGGGAAVSLAVNKIAVLSLRENNEFKSRQ